MPSIGFTFLRPTVAVVAALVLVTSLTVAPARADAEKVAAQLARSLERYQTAETWAVRRDELRETFLRGARLWPLPERPPVTAIRHSRREHDGYSVENVALETLPGFYSTGNLYRPLGRKTLDAIVLCPHGHFRPLGRYRESQQVRCAQLARMGATVFSYSMVGWQDSQQTTHNDPLVLALQTWNSLRTVDYLSGLERVDPRRVGVAGASGGGTQSMYLGLVDDRVTAIAPVVIVYPWTDELGCKCEGGMPVMTPAETNAIEVAAAISPRPQLLISVGGDSTRDFPELGFPFIRQMYDLAGAAGNVRNVHLADEQHDFGPSKRNAVYAFFGEHLGLEPVAEDLDRITIETPEQLAVFDEAHPLPDGAVDGADEVAAVFAAYLTALRETSSVSTSVIANVGDRPPAEYSFKPAEAADEALIFTPPGYEHIGEPRRTTGQGTSTLSLKILEDATGEPTPCRVNVVGADGNFYEPADNPLKEYSLTGVWPKSGWGNRQGKAPVRYFGRFFYCDGTAEVEIPAGATRIEVWKGFEYRPESITLDLAAGQHRDIELRLAHTAAMDTAGYWSGDPHIHIPRRSRDDEERVFDLLEAEGIHYGMLLAYNEPAGPYDGRMDRMESPQYRALGRRSIRSRGNFEIISGQEYRSASYGHLNLFMLDELVFPGAAYNADNWPPYGHIVREARETGGIGFYAHGGYAQEIYADVVQDNIDGVELLQFGVYRGIGLDDWYHMLNAGFRVPASGACDYPACRKLGDCKTYVYLENNGAAIDARGGTTDGTTGDAKIEQWLRGMAAGQSFVTTGPMLLLEVDGRRPGAQIRIDGDQPRRVVAKLRVRSEVAPVTDVQLIVNGRVVHTLKVPASQGQGSWIELEREIEIDESSWIAARAFSLSALGTPDAESHTNPVYVYIDDRAPYDRTSLDHLVAAIDGQIARHKQREFAEQARVVVYFERSRDILMRIRAAGGASAGGHPSEIARDEPTDFDPGAPAHSDEELRAFLKPLPAKPIEEVLESFETVDGLQMQLVAMEPLVTDPIAAAFDEDGNLYVCEMRDYPYKPTDGKRPIGSVRLLRDTDNDGTFDVATDFADELLWAGGVAPWRGGVFIAAPPDIWYMKDNDGDGVADVREKTYTGFGTGNQQAMLNNLTWGLDHMIYGSAAGNGGDIRHVGHDDEPAVSVDGHDFRFGARDGHFESITGSEQFGTTFDDWGNRFLCSQAEPVLYAAMPEEYLRRNPYLAVPSAVDNIGGQAVPIHRISPIERWRMIRSSRRIAHGARSANSSGASHHVVDAAAGVTVYRGGAYPQDYYGQVFVGDGQNNLVHRRRLVPDGLSFRSERVDEGTEVVRSSDIWFRPVNFLNAPDGTLYVLDMSREVLETIHVPLDVTKFLDFKSGRDRGRIYRLAPPEYQFPGPPRLGTASTGELVAALESRHGWWRDTAHRLIFERQDASATGPLRVLLRESLMPQARLCALWSLAGLDTLGDDDLTTALDDAHFAVVSHAIRLAEMRLDDNPALLARVIDLSAAADVRLRQQAAFSLGESHDPQAAVALSQAARSSGDNARLRTAVLSSAGTMADRILIDLLDDSAFCQSPEGATLLGQLASIVGARHEEAEVGTLLDALLAHRALTAADGRLGRQVVLALGEAMARAGTRLVPSRAMSETSAAALADLLTEARQTASDTAAEEGQRLEAVRLLACASHETSSPALSGLLDADPSEAVQLAAVRGLAGYADGAVAGVLLGGWAEYSPAVREAVIEAMLARTDRTNELLVAASDGRLAVSLFGVARRARLVNHQDAAVRAVAATLFGDEGENPRADVVDRYRRALTLDADKARGEKVFSRDCAACHKIGDVGNATGPDLTSSPSADAEMLLVHILDPNRYVLPVYEQYTVLDTSGRTYTGMIVSRTATSITLRREDNETETILRGNIDEMVGTARSLMPEGFETKITPEEMADLVEFLQTSLSAGPSEPKLHIGTLPGLIEP